MKQATIELTKEQVGHELEMWFKNEERESLARKTSFIQRSTSRLTGSGFFNLLTVDILDELPFWRRLKIDHLEWFVPIEF